MCGHYGKFVTLNGVSKLQNMLHANEKHAGFCVLVSLFPLV